MLYLCPKLWQLCCMRRQTAFETDGSPLIFRLEWTCGSYVPSPLVWTTAIQSVAFWLLWNMPHLPLRPWDRHHLHYDWHMTKWSSPVILAMKTTDNSKGKTRIRLLSQWLFLLNHTFNSSNKVIQINSHSLKRTTHNVCLILSKGKIHARTYLHKRKLYICFQISLIVYIQCQHLEFHSFNIGSHQ